MANFQKTALVADVPPGSSKAVSVSGKSVALYNVGGMYYATDNTCVHRGGPLGEGVLDGEVITCPWHGWQYDVKDGQCQNNPTAKLKTYPVKQEGADLLVAID